MSNQNREARPWDFFKKETKYASDEVAKKRLEICEQCDHFFKLTKQCKLCLCIMPAKTLLADAECPEHKWGITKEYTNRNPFRNI